MMEENATVGHVHRAARRSVADMARGYLSCVHRKHIVAGFLYLFIALVLFYPITTNMSTVAPGTGGDVYINMWGIWWAQYALVHMPGSFWYTHLLFWPIGSNIAYFTFSPIGAILTAPFQAISVTFAYDVIFFLGFLISGLGMFILADYIIKNKYAAFFAGIVYAFGSWHTAAAIGHLDWMVIGWIPLTLYFFLRMLRDTHKYRYAIGMGVCFVFATFMGDVEQGIMTVVLLAVVFIAYAVHPDARRLLKNRRFWYALGISVVAVLVVGSWGIIPIIHGYTSPGGAANVNSRNTLANDAEWSSPILSFLLPSPYNGLLYGLTKSYGSIYSVDPNERIAYIGYTALALAIIGIWKNFKGSRLWIIIAIFFGWMVLGPYVELGNYVSSGLPGIYYAYHFIPAFNVVQEADRFYAVFSIGITMLAAFGMKYVIERFHGHAKQGSYTLAIVGIITVLFLAESTGVMGGAFAKANTTSISIPQFYKELGSINSNFTVLQLPILINNYIPFPDLAAGEATFYTSASHKPILGGYGGRINVTQELTLYSIPIVVAVSNLQLGNFSYESPVNENYTAVSLLSLYDFNTAFVTINENVLNSTELSELEAYSIKTFGQPVYADSNVIAFSTISAINASIFRSFVAYPSPLDWTNFNVFMNGTSVGLWEPTYPGEIAVVAPYASAYKGTGASYINTTVSFYGAAINGPSTLSIETPTQFSSAKTLATFALTPSIRHYVFNVSLPSGIPGSELLFLTQGTGVAGITNITFGEQT